jgi:hypothetical protein
MKFIKTMSTQYQSGGEWLDFITLNDGRVLVINDDFMVLFANEDDFMEGDNIDRPTIDLGVQQFTYDIAEHWVCANALGWDWSEEGRFTYDEVSVEYGDYTALDDDEIPMLNEFLDNLPRKEWRLIELVLSGLITEERLGQ